MKQVESFLAGTPTGEPLEVLEPRDGKLSRAVLRGERGRKAPDLPGLGKAMHQYRVTKYDPSHRDELGHFTRADWTSFSDVGKNCGGTVLGLAEYERVEGVYVEAALGFMREAGVHTLSVRGIENSGRSPSAPSERAVLDHADLAPAMRGVLREEFWCRFNGEAAFIHFGYDYYMYIGVPVNCAETIAVARGNGLFVESFESPYHDEKQPSEDDS